MSGSVLYCDSYPDHCPVSGNSKISETEFLFGPRHGFISFVVWGNVENEICNPKLKETMVLIKSLEKWLQNATSFQK